jgi:hypothetical protein
MTGARAKLPFHRREQSWNFGPDDRQQPACIHPELSVRNHVAQAGKALSVHRRMVLSHLVGNRFHCLTEFDQSIFDRAISHTVRVRQRVKRCRLHVRNEIEQVDSGLTDVRQALVDSPPH